MNYLKKCVLVLGCTRRVTNDMSNINKGHMPCHFRRDVLLLIVHRRDALRTHIYETRRPAHRPEEKWIHPGREGFCNVQESIKYSARR